MRGRRQWLAAGGALALGGRAARAQNPRDLTVVSWGGAFQDAQRDVFFRPWMTARDERILEETWAGGIDDLRRRIQPGPNTWDLVQVESEELLIGCEEGLFEPMDWDAIGGREAYRPEAVSACGVGAIQYSFILAWDRPRVATSPRGWADLFDTARIPGRRALRRGPKTTLEIALLADGVPRNRVYAELATERGLAQAFRRLESIRADLAWWERGSEPTQWLAAGEVALTAAYNGRIALANAQDGRDFGIAWQQNLTTLDSWVIMRGSPNRARALAFLRFAGQPQVQAGLPPRIPYGMTAQGVEALLPGPLLARLPTAPPHLEDSLRIDDRFWVDNLDRLNRRFEAFLAG
ncbi:extracellular solute-binding protein [Falsiroseomonas sp. E2-1-a20]|uniref:extracellular solute-binding protein n=1 Tax=Falsiroseomonas sp. E2-1-a20 TaxID=3239300 RepID=UPI003F2B1F73